MANLMLYWPVYLGHPRQVKLTSGKGLGCAILHLFYAFLCANVFITLYLWILLGVGVKTQQPDGLPTRVLGLTNQAKLCSIEASITRTKDLLARPLDYNLMATVRGLQICRLELV